MGTPAFASPEQLRGDELDARSDIYAVGATLFTLLTARAPFEGGNAVQVVASVIDTPAPAVSRFRGDLPPGLEQVIARCLAKEPGGRYTGYAALRDALLPFGSAVPEPATQAQRTAAGWIDYLTAFLPTYAVLMITVGPESLFIRPLYEGTLAAWGYHLLVFAAGFVYFAVTEGVWGAGLGNWMMNLRVVRTNGRVPGVGRALLPARHHPRFGITQGPFPMNGGDPAMQHTRTTRHATRAAAAIIAAVLTGPALYSTGCGEADGGGRADIDRPPAPAISLDAAIIEGDDEAVRAHIIAGMPVNTKNPAGDTPLSLAAVFGRAHAAEVLVGAGAELEVKNNSGTTPSGGTDSPRSFRLFSSGRRRSP